MDAARGGHEAAQALADLGAPAGKDGGGHLAQADLLGVVGAGEHGHALGVPQLGGGDVQHELVRARLHALGEHEDGHVGCDVGRERAADVTQVRGRQGQDHGAHGA